MSLPVLKAYIFTGETLDPAGAVEDAMKVSGARDLQELGVTTWWRTFCANGEQYRKFKHYQW